MSWIKFFLPDIPTLETIGAQRLCVLPMPEVKKAKPKQPKEHDAYVQNQQTNTWGFHSATAHKQNEGSAPELTAYDISLLKERGYWGGKVVQGKNAKAKAAWHDGKMERETATALNVSESWVEKRYGTFSTALLEEKRVDEIL